MAIETQSLTDLPAASVAAAQAELTQLVQEAVPSVDARRGVLHDLVFYLNAALATKHAIELDRYLSARSLRQIEADPTLADDDIVADVLSNWGLTRQEGTPAVGEVVVVISNYASVTILAGSLFTADGRSFSAAATYTAKPEAAQINTPQDRLLRPIGNGNYAFMITVQAVETGAGGMLDKDALLAPETPPIGFVTAYAASDFTSGRDAETNAELIAKLKQGSAARVPASRISMMAALAAQPAFTRIAAQSIVGHGDPEMHRDKHTIWPGSMGGRADWYIRTQASAAKLTQRKTATLVSVQTDGSGLWQLEFGRDEAPGFYQVVRIDRPERPVNQALTLTQDTRALDLSGAGFIPDIQNAVEGVYSRYQTALIRFTDATTDHAALSPGETREYDVTTEGLPQIADAQAFASAYDHRSYGADVLIKAAVPCFLRLSFTLSRRHTQLDPDLDAIKAALVDVVSRTGFTGRLYAGQLHDAIYNHLIPGMSVGAIDMFGRIRAPAGADVYIRRTDVLEIPERPDDMIGARTTQFFLDKADIAIAVAADAVVPE